MFLRVLLPDGSTSVMKAKPAAPLRSVLVTLLNKKSDLPITSVEVFPLHSEKVSVYIMCISTCRHHSYIYFKFSVKCTNLEKSLFIPGSNLNGIISWY